MDQMSRRGLIGGMAALSGLPLLANLSEAASTEKRATVCLRFDTPATKWLEALPVGNGRLGGMVFGGIAKERIQLNHIELWSGRPAEDSPPETLATLPEVRRLLFAGQYAEANRLAQDKMMIPMNKAAFGSYQMLGDMAFDFDHGGTATDYSRELDMQDAVARVRYRVGSSIYTRTVIASFPDKTLVVRLETTAPEGLRFKVALSRSQDGTVERDAGTVRLSGKPQPWGTAFVAHLACAAEGGTVEALDDGFRVTGAKNVTLHLTGATDLLMPDPVTKSKTAIGAAQRQTWDQLMTTHRHDRGRLFNAVELQLGPAPVDIVADARLKAVQQGAKDPALAEAYFNFGRYLLISASRPGSLPANLQGLWADGFSPPWSADYHININIQMNYWLAEVCGLGELHNVLFDYVERLKPHGEITARDIYGAHGTVGHYTSNPWGHTAPDGQLQWGLWPEGLAWLSLHFWEHYLYTQDRDFLATRAWPFLKACAEFKLDYLVTHPVTGQLVSGPATSPENSYKLPDGTVGFISMGCAMSQSIALSVLTHCRDAAEILKADRVLQAACETAIARLERLKIGSDGRIMEWAEPFEEVEPGHRHISHLFGLHPADEIDVTDTPELAEAARKTLTERLRHGGGQTGWSAAWLTMFRARLGEGDTAEAMLEKLFRESTTGTYFDTHPWGSGAIFQIDGNLGATAAIAEMLLQSHRGRVRLLPALPNAWTDGRIRGLRARGGLIVDIDWAVGKATKAVLQPLNDLTCRLVAPPSQTIAGILERGKPVATTDEGVRLEKGRIYQVVLGEA